MKKILITGASGFVGSRTVAALQGTYELITPCHCELDITSEEAVESFICRTQPDVILHLAALSNTVYCEEHPQESYLVNVISVENIAKAAAKHGIKLVWFSQTRYITDAASPVPFLRTLRSHRKTITAGTSCWLNSEHWKSARKALHYAPHGCTIPSDQE